jgi:hypothetical protein
MAQSVCYLCRADAQSSTELDPESGSQITTVDCPRCGPYRLTPHAWNDHERACLAAYVQHESKARRAPPLIGAANWETLVRLGEALRERT